MANTPSVDVLNDLIKINNDRIVGYQKAIDELKEDNSDLKTLFSDMIAESMEYKRELSDAALSYGEQTDSENSTTTSGKLYRVWMDVKATFSGNDREAVLKNCETGEDAAQNAYEMALEDDDVTPELKELISSQKNMLRSSHDKIKALRDIVSE